MTDLGNVEFDERVVKIRYGDVDVPRQDVRNGLELKGYLPEPIDRTRTGLGVEDEDVCSGLSAMATRTKEGRVWVRANAGR